MDEATSNIDQFTDHKIQSILKKECKESTIGTFYYKFLYKRYLNDKISVNIRLPILIWVWESISWGLIRVTIAHRIETIIHYDKIVVLEQGQLEEIGTPMELIEKKGVFYELISKNGESFKQKMIKAAKSKQDSDINPDDSL